MKNVVPAVCELCSGSEGTFLQFLLIVCLKRGYERTSSRIGTVYYLIVKVVARWSVAPDFRYRAFYCKIRNLRLYNMGICYRALYIFPVPGYIIVSVFSGSPIILCNCVVDFLLYVYPWKNPLQLNSQSVLGVYPEFRP